GTQLGDQTGLKVSKHATKFVSTDCSDQRRRIRPISVETFDIGQYYEFCCSKRTGEFCCSGIGVDIKNLTRWLAGRCIKLRGYRRDDRDASVIDEIGDCFGVDFDDVADQSQIQDFPVDYMCGAVCTK